MWRVDNPSGQEGQTLAPTVLKRRPIARIVEEDPCWTHHLARCARLAIPLGSAALEDGKELIDERSKPLITGSWPSPG